MRRFSRILVLSSLPLAPVVMAQYAGSQACQACHSERFEMQSKTGHARALSLAPAGSPGQWAFGAGVKAITYVSRLDQDWYMEHGLSYYPERKSMGLTPGHATSEGRRYRTFEPVATTLRCFRCHSTGPLTLGPGQTISPGEPGVHCESCHGPGAAHVKAAGAPATIRNPKHLSAAELNEYCGSCHRKAGDLTDWSNSWNVRHQPAYLSQSACFRMAAGALSCLTCHDPHAPLNQSAAAYDKRCTGCHREVRHRTVVAARSCVDCHMPQVPTNAELHFTNHWIGVYAKGNTLVPVRRAGRGLPPPPLGRLGANFTPPADPSGLRPLFEQVLADRERQLGSRQPQVARSASDLGLFLKSIGETETALAPLRQALEIDRNNSDPMLAADQENLASALALLGRHGEAFELFRQAAAASDPAVAARSLSTMASLDPERSELYYRKALQSEEAASGKEHPRVALLLNNLALTLRQRDDNRSAEPLFRRALAIQQKTLGPRHPATASTLNNLGSLLQSTGRLTEAERVERAALRIFEEKLGPETAELATTVTNLADLVWTKGDRVEAARLYRRALAIDESIYGPDHPEVAGDLTNLGTLLKETGQGAAANTALRRALVIYEKAFGPDSPQARNARRNLAPAGP